jgi:hypothetical protein
VSPIAQVQQVRRVGHRLGAAGDHGVNVADADCFDRMHHRLHPGSADPVHGFAWHLDRKSRPQPGLPGDVHAVAGLEHAAHDRVPDVRRWDAGAGDRFSNHDRAEVDGGQLLQRAAKRADRRPAGAEDHDLEVFVHPGIIVLRSSVT